MAHEDETTRTEAQATARAALAARLGRLDWTRGLTVPELGQRLADQPGLQRLVADHLPAGLYFSPRDVLNALDLLPADAWRSGSTVAATPPEPTPALPATAVPNESGSATAGGSTAAQARQAVAQAAHGVGSAAARAAERARGLSSSVAPPALPRKVVETAAQARDQVLSIRTRGAEAEPLPEPPGTAATAAADPSRSTAASVDRRWVAVALSAVQEGVGQAYNRRWGKAAAFVAAGIGLSTASGLNRWLARRLFGADRPRLGPARIRPFLLGLFAATYLASLWDAWSDARPALPSQPPASRSPASWEDLAPPAERSPSDAGATDEYPIVGR